ncbi:MAG: cobaltochelatase subunit CobN [Muribaculaceae bacterium]|nr:cobaltochelatase subunit CobN [Muribaculaceae bacterium]
MSAPRTKTVLIILASILTITIAAIVSIRHFTTTRILVVNPLPTQAAELTLNNDTDIRVTCVKMEEAKDFGKYDAILLYGRGLYLDSLQTAELDKASLKGVRIFTIGRSEVEGNIPSPQADTLKAYFKNPCRSNYVNMLKYVRHLCRTSHNIDRDYDAPILLPDGLFYHLEPELYFSSADSLTDYLKSNRLYIPDGHRVALISGMTFPVEGNRAHIDSLISRLTRVGYNVYPLSAGGQLRDKLIKDVDPHAIIYLPMGRLADKSFIDWCYDRGVPIFMPFPLTVDRASWLDKNKPISGGTLTARIVIPETDGGMSPLCLATQDPNEDNIPVYHPVEERIDAFIEQFTRFMRLRHKDNADKHIAIVYYKAPGHDALLSSGLETIPSLYNFLKRLKREGYDVGSLPESLKVFMRIIKKSGEVMGDYASAAQTRFMDEADPVWLHKDEYESLASKVLDPEKYQEIIERYGDAPGGILSRGDSLAMAMVRFGNILLFPQPRPAVGDDDFKMAHGVDVAPPHSYIAPYLYMQEVFDADALIHFGTHGNLEFTPGKNAALSGADWADALVGNRPHFYFYTTGNIGESVIAKRRSHAVIVSHLTPPFIETGISEKYRGILNEIHSAISDESTNSPALRSLARKSGILKDLRIDTVSPTPLTRDELFKIDEYLEDLSVEKVTGKFYTMGEPYSDKDMQSTLKAMTLDKIAYGMARDDFKNGLISRDNLNDISFVRHHYHRQAEKEISDGNNDEVDEYRRLLMSSAGAEIESMIGALSGRPVRPAPGGDPVLEPNVLPMGRNMYSINAEATPGEKAWEDGLLFADKTLKTYIETHGGYPRKVSYSLWAGEFISTKGATLAQVLRMLGVEPVRDSKGRVMDLRLTPSAELGRPRIDVMVQVSGQLRDIAESRLKIITDAIRLASSAEDDLYPNYVAEGTLTQEKNLVDRGIPPREAREMSVMRVFGPVNSGYSTGMLSYTENSGRWEDRQELVQGYVNNMCAMYGDSTYWGRMEPYAIEAAVSGTDIIVQPRQSNTWGPLSLDHVYEFTGCLSMLCNEVNGKTPDAIMADYRNANLPKIQSLETAIAVETRTSLLNPVVIKQRMQGGASTAQTFGEIFRNIFGWTVTRPCSLTEGIFDELYETYIIDCHSLGLKEYFDSTNPIALQEMTATMLESIRKGYWKPSSDRIGNIARLHAEMTSRHGAPCTEFVCDNKPLQKFIATKLDSQDAEAYENEIAKATGSPGKAITMRKDIDSAANVTVSISRKVTAAIFITLIISIFLLLFMKKRK